jgi:outer membrane biosynthesis protein TonB
MRIAFAAVSGVMAVVLAMPAWAQTEPRPSPAAVPAAKPRDFVEMDYPAAALAAQMQGTVVVRAWADAGHVHLDTCSPLIDGSRRPGGR